jgi:hypothetical protein
MLFFMVGAAHLFAAEHWSGVVDEGGKRALWYIIVLAVGAIAEFIALKAPAPGSAISKHLDDHRNTIIGGFALTIVLYLILEGFFG